MLGRPHGGVEINEEGINELAMLKAIQVMDKSFRPLGAAAKSDAAFTIHEVCISARVHLLIMLATWNSCNDFVLW